MEETPGRSMQLADRGGNQEGWRGENPTRATSLWSSLSRFSPSVLRKSDPLALGRSEPGQEQDWERERYMHHHPAPQVWLGFVLRRHPTPQAWLLRAASVRRQTDRSLWSFCRA